MNSNEWIKNLEPLNEDFPKTYQLKLVTKNAEENLKFLECGEDSPAEQRTVMLIGETGCGKTLLINAIINYIAGIQFSDDCRLQLEAVHDVSVNEENLSDEIKVYKIFPKSASRVPYTLNIIDVPGISSSQNKERDDAVVQRTEQVVTHHFQTIHAVCLVINSTIVRLTDQQSHVIQMASKLFQTIVANKKLVLCTRSISCDEPVVMTTLRNIHFSHDGCFRFENSVFSGDTMKQNKNVEKMARHYENNESNFENFFITLGTGESKQEAHSSQMTQDISLNEWKDLDEDAETLDYGLNNKQEEPSEKYRSSYEIINYYNMSQYGTSGLWTIYNLPLVEIDKAEKFQLQNIRIWETPKSDCTKYRSILIFGSNHQYRNEMVEFIANCFMRIQPEEYVWFKMTSNTKTESEADWAHVYKLYHPLHDCEMVTVFTLPDIKQNVESREKSIEEQFKLLWLHGQLRSVDSVLYLVDDNIDAVSSAYLSTRNKLSELITIGSFGLSVEDLKELNDKLTDLDKLQVISDSVESLKSGYQYVRRIFEREQSHSEYLLNDLLEFVNCLTTEIDPFADNKKCDEELAAKFLLVKIVKPNYAVLNCENCRQTCCTDQHKKKSSLRLAWEKCLIFLYIKKEKFETCVVQKNRNCDVCQCSCSKHCLSDNVQYVRCDPETEN